MTPSLILPEQQAEMQESLRAVFAEYTLPLFRIMEYQMGWLDEHGMPMDYPVEHSWPYAALCFAACKAVGGQPEAALPMATALELLENFFQVHIDIQKGRQDRYNRPTVWWVWGPGQAINVGDAFHALARLTIMASGAQRVSSETTLKAVEALDTASLRVCEGIHMDLVYQERVDVTVDAYLRMAREKAGALMGCAMELGALSSSASPETAQALRKFGENLGIASRVREDVRELWEGPADGITAGSDLLNKEKTLPVAYAFAEGSISQKRALGNIYFKRVLGPEDLGGIAEILNAMGAKTYAQNTSKHFLSEALDCLDGLEVTSSGRSDLERIARDLTL